MRIVHYVSICMQLCLFGFSHASVPTPVPPAAGAQAVPSFAYSSYADVMQTLTTLAAANPDVAYLFSIGTTYQGRQQWVLRITSDVDGNVPNNKPAIWFSACIHARERMVPEVALAFATYLCAHKNDPAVQPLIQSLDIYIMPMGNPDGVEYNGCCQSTNCWRRDMELHHDRAFESIVPAVGAGTDMNRTWDYEWDYAGSAKVLQNVTYRGEQPIITPEIRNIRKFTNSLPTLVANIDWHSASGSVYYIWNGKYDDVDNAYHRNVLMSIAKGFADITGYIAKEGNLLYLSSGDTSDSDEAVGGIIALTIEVLGVVDGLNPNFTCELFTPPYPSAIATADINNNVQAALYVLNIVKNGPYKSY